jgi:hypothetical protein
MTFLSDSDEPVPNEEAVIWLEDVSTLPYVRENFAITHRRQSRIPYGGEGRVVGYTILSKNAPRRSVDDFGRPEFLRRVFILTEGDRANQLALKYYPMEAVDPRSIAPSTPSRDPEDEDEE